MAIPARPDFDIKYRGPIIDEPTRYAGPVRDVLDIGKKSIPVVDPTGKYAPDYKAPPRPTGVEIMGKIGQALVPRPGDAPRIAGSKVLQSTAPEGGDFLTRAIERGRVASMSPSDRRAFSAQERRQMENERERIRRESAEYIGDAPVRAAQIEFGSKMDMLVKQGEIDERLAKSASESAIALAGTKTAEERIAILNDERLRAKDAADDAFKREDAEAQREAEARKLAADIAMKNAELAQKNGWDAFKEASENFRAMVRAGIDQKEAVYRAAATATDPETQNTMLIVAGSMDIFEGLGAPKAPEAPEFTPIESPTAQSADVPDGTDQDFTQPTLVEHQAKKRQWEKQLLEATDENIKAALRRNIAAAERNIEIAKGSK